MIILNNILGFDTPPGMMLDPNNRWVRLSDCIPWDNLAQSYHKTLSATSGRLCKDARIVIGAIIIKHKLSVSDEETVEQIRENPYLQYFIGLKSFQSKAFFASLLLVYTSVVPGKNALYLPFAYFIRAGWTLTVKLFFSE